MIGRGWFASLAVLLVAVSLGTLAPAGEPKAVELIGDDLGAWRADAGGWTIVGDARMDPNDSKKLAASSGEGVLVNGPSGKTKNILSRIEHGDVEAHIEFLVPQGSNSGVYFQGRYEIQILDSWGVEAPGYGDCGGVYERPAGGGGRGPRVNASLEPGRWQTFDVVFRAARFNAGGEKVENARFVRVVHNGQVIHEDVELLGPTRSATFAKESPTGPLMLQGDHGPVAYRNIRLTVP